jgi:hypothetical protein
MSTKITVAGFISDPLFHKARVIAQKIEQGHKNVRVESLEFFETQWEQFLKKTANTLKGSFYNH